ncbi:lipoyl(octanoyl) transferase LipB [Moraxella oblonga]|uniref:lipoyl(octanoyl) transferase LipB n=1 Tax=Moraxella oblonga TaxID=200413 RepID=UPI0008368053|nr:lipoyl(octanoyl) transferase LipB [Moraxella oblonga]
MSNNLTLHTLSLPPFDNLIIKTLPNADYTTTHTAMFDKTLQKIDQKKAGNPLPDELWLVEHSDVYTLGQAGKKEHILYDTGTPIIQTDRGGQVTWHGTGQLTAYFLWDLNALCWGVRDLVSHAEQAIEDVVNAYLPNGLTAKARKEAPGVYVYNTDGDMLGKIASLGFKIKHSHSYHGIAINLINDLIAFNAINPCGYAGMTMVKLAQFCEFDSDEFILKLTDNLVKRRNGTIALRKFD